MPAREKQRVLWMGGGASDRRGVADDGPSREKPRGFRQTFEASAVPSGVLFDPQTAVGVAVEQHMAMLPLALILLVGSALAQTPVIGGTCKLGTADVQIGGKQTQFFLKCEATADSTDGEGVWVVKSRAAASAAPAQAAQVPLSSAQVPAENTQPQQHPKSRKQSSPNICEQDNGARESETCAVSATCLQAHNEFPSSYLQCDQTTLRWTRKSCQDGFLFNFEQQTCIVPKRMSSLSPLCSDGSSPSGNCNSTTTSSCPKEHFCTSQGVCCPMTALQATSSCLLMCSVTATCPKGMMCYNNCCEERKIFRHPESWKDWKESDFKDVFAAKNDVFDTAAIEAFPTLGPLPLDELEEVTTTSTTTMRPTTLATTTSSEMPKENLIDSPYFRGSNTLKKVVIQPVAKPGSIVRDPIQDTPRDSTWPIETTTKEMPRSVINEVPRDTSKKVFRDPSWPRKTETSKAPRKLGSNWKIRKPNFDPEPATCNCPTTPAPTLTGTCGGTNAVCKIDADCPPTFACEGNCCRLAVCPKTGAVARFSCTSKYNCRAGEVCLFGGCCPIEVEAAGAEPYDFAEKRTTSVEITTTPVPLNGCSIDDRVKNCDFDHPCPETSECVAGTCCKIAASGKMWKWLDGPSHSKELRPLGRLSHRLENNEVAELSEVGNKVLEKKEEEEDIFKNVPLPENFFEKTEKKKNKMKPLPDIFMETTEKKNKMKPLPDIFMEKSSKKLPDVFTEKSKPGLSFSKGKCLSSQKCDLRTLCPPQFTCSLDGRCCKMNVLCPDGTVPESACDGSFDAACPSSSHACLTLEHELSACCVVVKGFDVRHHEVSHCPSGSSEVAPKFGNFCRYSLQCPSPYFCNNRGRQQANGLLCTFSSCSNSNPCNVGTCNNGYCCSSSGSSNQNSAIIPEKTTKSTTNKKRKHRKPSKKEKKIDLTAPLADFPVGPPGYGFPEHLATLDDVLIKATGDGNSCAGGFSSSLVCSLGAECPPGLHCDRTIGLCCPLLLPLTDPANPKPERRHRKEQRSEAEEAGAGGAHLRFSSYAPCNSPCFTPSSNNNCVGCGAASPQIITIPSSSGCPGGGYSVGTCNSGYCATGYSCVQNQCCPSYSAPQVSVYSCPSGGSAVGACISGQCATGYSCYNNACCPSTTTQNPFVCPDGTQAAGGCVNGQCGTGYTCSNGLCCVGTTTTVRCLDGSSAVGACIPSCTGNACGGVQVSYYCGTGYTCTTGNICCPVNSCPNGGTLLGPAVNGLCPNGYTLQGDVCCSSLCTDGSAGTPAINGICPGGTTLTNGVCCASTVTCDVSISNGPCTGVFNGGCSAGHACDTTQNICCPIVDFNDANDQVGPCLDGTCPALFVCVLTPNNDFIDPVTGDNPGVCVSLQSVPGVCDVADQVGVCNTDTATGTCPTGFTCFTAAGICCTDGTVFSRLRGAKRPNNRLPAYGRPLNSYMPPRIGGSSTCADGSLSAGACMNGLCGLGHVCQNGQCCNPSSSSSNGGGPDNKLQSVCPSGETAVSGCFIDGTCGVGFECVRGMNLCCPPGQPSVGPSPSNILPSQPQNIISPRPIGARCQFDGECVGQQEGLSMCHAGVCQCSPIAYSQGIACIRRKSFQMNDEPTMDGEKPGQIVKSV
ncbi:unnamed protein product [Caenorhabditis auriculariae]|uniref:Chitin-binding type-2 domain-containing protein n=1 Tax=Caenorhabditis auriculariae TaxID=2777116 RepID=A0A8S1GS89_9PELO|nr:unnamed protein product [Caenorhabditis auriculariae]